MKEMIEKLKKMSLIKKNYNYLYSCSHFSSIYVGQLSFDGSV